MDIIAAYQDITVFPIMDEEKRVIYIAAILINRRVYRGKDEIEKAKEYIETHWMERFDLNETARAACLSKAHFTKLFKKHTGIHESEEKSVARTSGLHRIHRVDFGAVEVRATLHDYGLRESVNCSLPREIQQSPS